MLFGRVNYEAQTNAKADRLIWLDVRIVDTLTAASSSAPATAASSSFAASSTQ
jgi:hypothetical protein